MIAINIGTYEVPEWVDLAVGGSGGGLPIITAGSAGKVVAVKTDESGYELVSSGSALSQYIKTITKSTNSITWKNKDETTDTFSVDFSSYQTLINATNKLSFSYLKDLPTTLAGYGITDVFNKSDVTTKLNDVTAIAEGKTKSIVILKANNANFNSQNADITATSVKDINNKTYGKDDLKIGDIVYLKDTDVPDRWLSAINADTGVMTFSCLEISKTILTGYVTETDLTNTLANYQSKITDSNKLSFTLLKDVPTTISGYGITDAFTKTEIQTNYQAKALLTAFQATPDDTHYISEKLAYDQFNLKEAKGNKVDLIIANKTSSDKYPSTKGVYNLLASNVDINITNGHIEIVAFGGIKHKFKIVPDSGYMLPDSITFGTGITDGVYTKTTGIVTFTNPNVDSTITINCPQLNTNFLNCSWDYINTKCVALENGTITTTEFCASFKNGTTAITSMDGFVGLERSITVNGQVHKVRVIGTQHDTLSSDNSKKAALTFEFKQLLSDSDGYSLGIVWNDTNASSGQNQDYINSSIRKALCGNGTFATDVLYAQKGQTTFSATYKNKTILSMLPTDLTNVIKSIKKSVGTTNAYTETSYDDKLFMLSVIEQGLVDSSDKGYGTTYKYYEGHTSGTDAIRIKKQVKGTEVSTSISQIPSGSGQVYANKVYNYAGYNSQADETGGGIYWYRSPLSDNAIDAWYCFYGGDCYNNIVYYFARGVAPAFCI